MILKGEPLLRFQSEEGPLGANCPPASASTSPKRSWSRRHSRNRSPTVLLNATVSALADFARWHRSQQEGLVIGVTGSFGKTTTREMIHAVLSASHSGIRSLKNFNNHIGLPLSLLELDHF